MNFTLYELKNLFEKYSVIKKGKNEVVINKCDNEKVYNSDVKLVTSVKFAYAWVYANSYKYSKNFLELDENIDFDFDFAFNEDSEYLYNTIIDICREFMETTGDMIKCEALINFVLEAEDISDDVISIIQKLYSKEELYRTFEAWIIYLVKSTNIQKI